MRTWALAANFIAASALMGCGNGAPSGQAAAPPAARGIFISASDCAAANKISIDECGRAIDLAIATYQEKAPTYASLRSCEAVAGPDRCARGVDDRYRAQLQAFLVTMSNPADAEALWPPSDRGLTGFKSAKGVIKAFDDGYTISADAQAMASDNSRLAEKTP